MTTEDDFQAALDTRTDDWQCRLVFADWLGDRGDLRAEGYRAAGVRRWVPYDVGRPPQWTVGDYQCPDAPHDNSELPADWFGILAEVIEPQRLAVVASGRWTGFPTRREAEDAVALAFSKLPPERRAELLAGVPGGE